MTNLIYNGQQIEQRDSDGYVNGTAMCQATGKKINDWLRLSATEAYIQELALNTGIPANELYAVKEGAPSLGGGTWLHALLALNLGRWISPPFAIWCDQHIKTLIKTGSTALDSGTLDLIQQIIKECEETREYYYTRLKEIEDYRAYTRALDRRRKLCSDLAKRVPWPTA